MIPIINKHMKTKFNLILTSILFLYGALAFAQQTVTGTVTDESGAPIPGATIFNSNNSTTSDFDGNFEINSFVDDVITVSYVGYNQQQVTVTSLNVNVVLESSTSLDEVVVVGYGSSTKESLVHSVASIDGETIEKTQATSITQALQGTVSGVTVLTSGGVPGSGQTIRIRGIGSINASASPLIVVDGVIFNGSINSIPQEQVESISVLKDASAAVYGSRGANGVVIINTKKGKKNSKGSFTFSSSFGSASEAVDMHPVLDADTYTKYFWEAMVNSYQYEDGETNADARTLASSNIVDALGYNPYGTGVDSPISTDGVLVGAPQWDTDWYGALVNSNAIRRNNTMSYSGGSDSSNYFISMNYLHEEGQVKTTWFDRFSLRSNFETNITDDLSWGLNTSYTNTVNNTPTQSGSGYANVIQWINTVPSIYPIYRRAENGDLILDNAGNPIYDYGSNLGNVNASRTILTGENTVGSYEYYKFKNNSYNLNANTYMSFKINDDFNFKSTLSYGRGTGVGFSYVHYLYGYASTVDGRVSQDRDITTTLTTQQQLNYDKSFGNHNLSADVIYENYALKVDTMGAQGIGFLPNVEVLNGSTSPEAVSGAISEERLESYISRLSYNYDKTYFLEGSYRRDGSSRFAEDVRWGDFFSVGGSWILSNESFVQNISQIDFMKLRASYGEVGNNRGIGYFPYMQLFVTGWNNLSNTGVLSGSVADPNLAWEKTSITNVGLDFGIGGRFSGAIEYYSKESIDLIYDKPLAISTGNESITTNVGSIKNTGIEFTLDANVIKSQDLNFDLGFNISTNSNEITELTQDEFISGTKKWMVGKSLYDWYIREWAGVDPDDGYGMWYVDTLDDDGNVTGRETTKEYSEATRYYIDDKSSLPKYTGGITANINYKNFDFSTLLYFSLGSYQYDSQYASLMSGMERNDQGHPDLANRWQQPGDVTDVPLLLNTSNDFNATSTRFLYKNDWGRVKSLSLGYTFDDEVNTRLKTQSIRVFLQGDNLFTLSSKDGIDPEQTLSGLTGSRSYQLKTISLGLNIKI